MSRIAMLSLHTCPLALQEGEEIGGMNIYVLEIAKQLVKKGFAIDIFTYFHAPVLERIIVLESNLRIIHIPLSKVHIPKHDLITYIPEFTENFLTFLKEQTLSYDYIDSHYYLSGLAGIEIKKKLGEKIPHIVTFHTLSLLKNLTARSEEEKENLARIDAELLLVHNADKIIAGSNSDKEYLEYLYHCKKEKLALIYPGVDTNLFTYIEKTSSKKIIGISENKKILLFVGRIEPVKGIETLLYALKILFMKYKKTDIQLLILGSAFSTPYKNELLSICSQLELLPFVTFIDQKAPEELVYYYTAAEMLVQPSLYERFGMSALEAMSCGTPVITTDATGVSDILKKYPPLITSVNNPLLLAKKIEYLLSNETFYKELTVNMRKEVQNFTWEKTAEHIIEYFPAGFHR